MRLPLLAAITGIGAVAAAGSMQRADQWTPTFAVEPGELHATGRNPYFILEPGYQLVLADGSEQLVITVLGETKLVDGVETRVVEERETKGGALVEISRNYYAISARTNSVFYFGEDVDMYTNGKVTSHDGAWHSGVNGAKFGLMMPGLPLLGARYYQEVAAKVAMDRAQILTLGDSTLRTEETTPLEPGHTEYKQYRRGVGLIADGSLKFVRAGHVK